MVELNEFSGLTDKRAQSVGSPMDICERHELSSADGDRAMTQDSSICGSRQQKQTVDSEQRESLRFRASERPTMRLAWVNE